MRISRHEKVQIKDMRCKKKGNRKKQQFWAANDLSEEQPIERGTGERAGTV